MHCKSEIILGRTEQHSALGSWWGGVGWFGLFDLVMGFLVFVCGLVGFLWFGWGFLCFLIIIFIYLFISL